jgi:hypothetical protein
MICGIAICDITSLTRWRIGIVESVLCRLAWQLLRGGRRDAPDPVDHAQRLEFEHTEWA